jgi:F-type H+-transporting ATPase subunit delta
MTPAVSYANDTRPYIVLAHRVNGLTLTDLHQSLYSSASVTQVNIPAATGDMGILANHVASVEALRPGVVEVLESGGGAGKKWFGELDVAGIRAV